MPKQNITHKAMKWLKYLFYLMPVRVVRNFSLHRVKVFLDKHLLHTNESNLRIAMAVALGVFSGIVPVWGYQTLMAIGLAHVFKLNKIVAVLASNISIPPLIPVWLYLSYVLGGTFLHQSCNLLPSELSPEIVLGMGFQYVLGAIVFALLMAVVCGFLSFCVLKICRKS